MIAAWRGHADALELLRWAGANVSASSHSGGTAADALRGAAPGKTPERVAACAAVLGLQASSAPAQAPAAAPAGETTTVIPTAAEHAGAGTLFIDGGFAEPFLKSLDALYAKIPAVVHADRSRTSAIRSYHCDVDGSVSRAITAALGSSLGQEALTVLPRMRFLCYRDVGGDMQPHVDLSKRVAEYDQLDATKSTHTFMLHLADCATGGETAFLTSVGALQNADAAEQKEEGVLGVAAPKRGRLIVFPHECPHAGLPCVDVPKHFLRGELLWEEGDCQPSATEADAGDTRPRAADGVAVETRQGRGRCAVASRDFAEGETIVTELPLAQVLHHQQWGHRCNGCLQRTWGKGRHTVYRCGGCGRSLYCSRACAAADWERGHCAECGTLRRMPESIHPDMVELLLLARLTMHRPAPTLEALERTAKQARAEGDDELLFYCRRLMKAAKGEGLPRPAWEGQQPPPLTAVSVADGVAVEPEPEPEPEPKPGLDLQGLAVGAWAVMCAGCNNPECICDLDDRLDDWPGYEPDEPEPAVAPAPPVQSDWDDAEKLVWHREHLACEANSSSESEDEDREEATLIALAGMACQLELAPSTMAAAQWLARFQANNFALSDGSLVVGGAVRTPNKVTACAESLSDTLLLACRCARESRCSTIRACQTASSRLSMLRHRRTARAAAASASRWSHGGRSRRARSFATRTSIED
eukprot:COSAG04_NODE_34_length_34523_cov_40.302446_25_plen_701_part_00